MLCCAGLSNGLTASRTQCTFCSVHSFADDYRQKKMLLLACQSSNGVTEQGGGSLYSQGTDKHLQMSNACCFAASHAVCVASGCLDAKATQMAQHSMAFEMLLLSEHKCNADSTGQDGFCTAFGCLSAKAMQTAEHA